MVYSHFSPAGLPSAVGSGVCAPAIKEELEIMQLLDADHPDRADLEARLDGRLSRYLRAPDLEKVTWQGLVLSAVIALVLLQVWPQVGLEPTSGLGQTVLGMGTGASAVLLAAGSRLAYVMAVPAKRAAFLAVVRDAGSGSDASDEASKSMTSRALP